jgi:hypothetical protein
MCNSHKTNIAALLRKGQNTTAVNDEAKLGRQRPERFLGRQPSRELSADASHIQHLGGINSGKRIDHHVAHRLTVRTVVEQSECCDHLMQWPQRTFVDAPELQIGAPRQIDVAVAETPRRIGEYPQFARAERPGSRAYADDKSVATLHRPQSTGAPALHLKCRRMVHSAFSPK